MAPTDTVRPSVAPERDFSEWVYEATRIGQLMLYEAAMPDPGGLARVLRLADDIPLPRTALERLVYLGVMFQVVLGSMPGPSPFVSRAREVMRRSLEQWRQPVMPPRADRAAALIAARATGSLDVQSLASEIGCDVTLLRREFKARFGVSMKSYHLCVRVALALRAIAGDARSISDIAAAAGYESEKNFYRAVWKVTGHTPAELRHLAPAELHLLLASVVPARLIAPRSNR